MYKNKIQHLKSEFVIFLISRDKLKIYEKGATWQGLNLCHRQRLNWLNYLFILITTQTIRRNKYCTWKCGDDTHLASWRNNGITTFTNSLGSITSKISSSSFKNITCEERHIKRRSELAIGDKIIDLINFESV